MNYEDQFYIKPVMVYHLQWMGTPVWESNHPSRTYFKAGRTHKPENMEVSMDYINTMIHPNVEPVKMHEEDGFIIVDGDGVKVGGMRDFYRFTNNPHKRIAQNPFPNELRHEDGYFTSREAAEDVLQRLKKHFSSIREVGKDKVSDRVRRGWTPT